MVNETAGLGRELHGLAARLFPITRSLTGPGVRETLEVVRDLVEL